MHAQNGVYDADRGILVLTGNNLRLDLKDATIVARDSLEYYDREKYAVARGAAHVAQADRRLKADVLVAYLRENADGDSVIYLMRGYDNVFISTATELVQGDRAEYNLDTEIATILGSVRITRGDTQLNGKRAQINLRTGVSRLVGAAGPNTKGRVQGLFVPDEENPFDIKDIKVR